jgi:hypothetical protein
MQTRLIHQTGVRLKLRRYWGDTSNGQRPCPGTIGKSFGYHNAELHLEDRVIPGQRDGDYIGSGEEYLEGGKPPDTDPRWTMTCSGCGEQAPENAERQVFLKALYNTASGNPEPGDLHWARWMHFAPDGTSERCFFWDNCNDPRGHLVCELPDGHPWDIEGRASNCTMPEDKTHRCWVRHGDPDKGEPVHVDKAGHTCAAGAGSIATPGYHGFLHNGQLTSC